MSRLEEMLAPLRATYVRRLHGTVEALQSLRAGLGRDVDVTARVRTVAHQLAGTGASFGFPELSERARAVEYAPAAELGTELDRLITHSTSLLGPDRAPTVLIADPRYPRIMKREPFLTKAELNVLEADSPAIGLRCLAEQRVDLVVLDVGMNDCDSADVFVEALVERRTPVILMSGTPTTTWAGLSIRHDGQGLEEGPDLVAAVRAILLEDGDARGR